MLGVTTTGCHEEYTAVDPARLIGVGLLPAATLQDSIDELRRVATLPGVRGLQLQEWPNGSGAPAPEDDSFWTEVVTSGVAMVAHTDFGGGHLADPTRSPDHFFTISFLTTKGGAPYSASELITTGVFDRIPDLRVYYVHGSVAWVEYWGEQADDHYRRHRYWAGSDLPHPPSHYIKTNLMHNFTVDPVGLADPGHAQRRQPHVVPRLPGRARHVAAVRVRHRGAVREGRRARRREAADAGGQRGVLLRALQDAAVIPDATASSSIGSSP